MPAAKPKTYAKRRLTHTEVGLGGKTYCLTFAVDGVQWRAKHARGGGDQRTYADLVQWLTGEPAVTAGRVNPAITKPAAVTLDLAAEDLKHLAGLVQTDTADAGALAAVRDQLTAALRVVKAKLLLA